MIFFYYNINFAFDVIYISVTIYLSTRGLAKQQVPHQMEESSIIPKQEEEDENITKTIQAQEVMEELEECKTPTSNKIPVIKNCPPAPRKKRRSSFSSHSIMIKRSSATELKYVVKPKEVDSFFQSMFELTKVINKRCRSI